MAFTVTDFDDLTRLLAERPEWQAELRRLILTEDLLALPGIVRELAEAQRELTKAQQRTEERLESLATKVEELAEAQRRTEAQVQALTARVDDLVDAQQRTEERVDGLATAVANLQRAFGATVEEEAESYVRALLEEKSYRLLETHHSVVIDGEVDVAMELEAPSGETVWAVVEAKARLGYRQVRSWGQRMKSSGWQEQLAAEGVVGPYLVYAFGIRIDPGAVAAAEEQGIGLITGRGEQVAPGGLIDGAATK